MDIEALLELKVHLLEGAYLTGNSISSNISSTSS